MKKTLLILSLILCFATSAKADDTATSSLSDSEWCPNGVVEKGAHPTKRYCRSTFNIDWYTALSWCQAQGKHLATLSEVCDKSENLEDRWDLSTGAKKCPNFANGEASFTWSWTGTVSGSTNAYGVNAGTGNSNNHPRNHPTGYYALCYQSPLLKTYEKTSIFICDKKSEKVLYKYFKLYIIEHRAGWCLP